MLFIQTRWSLAVFLSPLCLNGIWDVPKADSYCREAACSGWWAVPAWRDWSGEAGEATGVYNMNVERKQNSYVSSHWELLFRAACFSVRSITCHPFSKPLCLSLMCTTLLFKYGQLYSDGAQRTCTKLKLTNMSNKFVTVIIIFTSGWLFPWTVVSWLFTEWLYIMEKKMLSICLEYPSFHFR